MLTEITALPEVWIPTVLALFGVGAFFGLAIGGRISDRRPHLALLAGASAIAVLSVVMADAIRQVGVVVPTVFLLGIAAFVVNPAIYGRVFAIAAGAPTLAGATTGSAFQLGISITPALAAARSPEESRSPPSAWSGPALAVRRCRSSSSTGPDRPA